MDEIQPVRYIALLEGVCGGSERVYGEPVSNYMQTCTKPYPPTGETSVEV